MMKKIPTIALSALVSSAAAAQSDECQVRADYYEGSLIGQIITVDKEGNGFDFEIPYGHYGLKINDVFRVTADNLGITEDGSNSRHISFERVSDGTEAGGSTCACLKNCTPNT